MKKDLILIKPEWLVPKWIKSFSTTRIGGCSQAPFDELNLGLHVDDSIQCVLNNRQIIQQETGCNQPLLWLNQVHSTTTIHSNEHIENIDADAIFTQKQKQPLAIMTADCLPILLTNQSGSEISAIHAGWKGLAQGILQNTTNKMLSEPQELIAWLGPCISQKYFEVGNELLTSFKKIDPHYLNGFKLNTQTNKYHACLRTLVKNQLSSLGVNHIYQSSLCTYTESKKFYSYRREIITGRMATIIWIDRTGIL
jgi:polyphenol oxidase